MSVLKIQAPDGMIRRIEVPDGADPAPAYAWVQEDYRKRQAAARKENDPTAGMGEAGKLFAGIGSGLKEKWLGTQQLANWATGGRVGNKEALEAAVKEQKATDKPLMGTTAGTVGNITGTLLPDLVLGGGVGMARTGAAKLLPRLATAPMPVRAAAAGTAAAGEGALQALTTGQEDYDPAAVASKGAAYGVGGDVAGRVLGRVIKPFRKLGPSQAAKEQYDILEAAGIPAPIAQTMTDNKSVALATHALAQLPFFNKAITDSHRKNTGWFTKNKTDLAGSPMDELTMSGAGDVRDRLSATAQNFRAGPDVPLTNVPADLAAVHGQFADTMAATGGNQRKLIQLLNTTSTVPSFPADAVMDARQKLSDQAFGHGTAGRYVERDQAKALQKVYEDALRSTHADGGAAFDQWKRQHGAWKDVERSAALPGGQTASRLEPARFAADNLDDAARLTPRTAEDAFTVAAANRMAPLPSTENRAWITNMLMGTPVVGALLGGEHGDNAAKAGAGAVGALELASLLLGTKGGGKYLVKGAAGDYSDELIKRLLITGRAGAQQAND